MAKSQPLPGSELGVAGADAPDRVGPSADTKGGVRSRDTLEELVRRGALDAEKAESVRRGAIRLGVSNATVLLQRKLVSKREIADARAFVTGVQRADLSAYPPQASLIAAYGSYRAIQSRCVPWRRVGLSTLVVAPSQAAFDANLPELEAALGPCTLALAAENEIVDAVVATSRTDLARQAETRLDASLSCRDLGAQSWRRPAAIAAIIAFLALCISPVGILAAITLWATLTLVATTALKLATIAAYVSRRRAAKPASSAPLDLRDLPKISILVPLYQETQLTEHLIARLQKLSYPREQIEVILVMESDDFTTRDALAAAKLPHWIRHVTVPQGRVKTKPRALNFAIDHAQGSIIGIYDAEDAPEPDQLLKVAEHFAQAPPDVACLQGKLDYYNPHQNWLSRCFTLEYAAWFRMILPGLAWLGWPVPLGGTTLFFRRDALEELDGWDAHNVTEDADLGLRLARAGYRTELVDAVTYEEANCSAWPWVRQRSRWLKGYALTYAVHMRAPRQLWKELGPWGFLGVQVLFACTLSQFLLAPVLWSFWLVLFGYGHALVDHISGSVFLAMMGFFVFAELVGFVVATLGVRRTRHRGLVPWIPTMILYFTLGTVAAYKAMIEVFGRPFFWDKTTHGVAPKTGGARSTPPLRA
ncbi:MAG: glycosyltransferase family 2 protein [Pseudomonadota bacterium]